MASAEENDRTERETSCFSRAARSIRRALARICGNRSRSDPIITYPVEEFDEYSGSHFGGIYSGLTEELHEPLAGSCGNSSRSDPIITYPDEVPEECYGSDFDDMTYVLAITGFHNYTDETYLYSPETSSLSSIYENMCSETLLPPQRRSRFKRKKRVPSVSLTKPALELLKVSNRDTSDSLLNVSRLTHTDVICSQSTAPTVASPPCPQSTTAVLLGSPFCTEGDQTQDGFNLQDMQSESQSGSDMMETEESVTAVNYSVTNTLPAQSQIPSSDPGPSQRGSSCLTRSHSAPSLSPITSTKNKTLTPAKSLPDMLLKSSFEEFTPEITPNRGPAGHDHVKHPLSSFYAICGSSGGRSHDGGICLRSDTLTSLRHHHRFKIERQKRVPSVSLTKPALELLKVSNRDTSDSLLNVSRLTHTDVICSQSTAPTVAGPPCPQSTAAVFLGSPFCTEGDQTQDGFNLQDMQSESQSGSDMMETEESVTAVNYSVTNTLPAQSQIPSSDPGPSQRGSSCLTRSHSAPSLSPITSTNNKTLTPAESLPDMLLKSSFEEFTPEITADEGDETYRLQCSRSGLYQCSVTGLVFHMDGEGDVVYRTVPWNRRLLAQYHKQPAGPLFDIECVQQSVCQLHLPHCEIRSTAAPHFLSVAHVNDEGVEFIAPHKITETHVVINITGFSGFGNVKDGDSPPEPVRALVLLFYRPPADPDPESLLNVLLLPRNVVLRDVLRTRKKLVGDERYIETSPHCKLQPRQEYTLSTCPEDDSVLVQPTEAEFDSDNYDDYFPSFQVSLETVMKHIKLFLRDVNKHSVWERRVCLWSTGVKRSCGPSALNLPPNERLLNVRSSFLDGISGPVLKSLLDKLFEKTVLSDPERESAAEIQNRRDKAGFVLDTVRKKGEAASSEMIEILCEEDPFLSEHLGLI